MRHIQNNRKSAYDACRSFFVYKNGDLFVQFSKPNDTPITAHNQKVNIKMKGATIIGYVSNLRGTGVILKNWQIWRTLV